ncbi:hypothetical protein AHAS_Ahas02G0229800 [Arachis hypogaea]
MASTIPRNGVVQRGTAKLDRQGANNNSILRTKPRHSHPPGPAALRRSSPSHAGDAGFLTPFLFFRFQLLNSRSHSTIETYE